MRTDLLNLLKTHDLCELNIREMLAEIEHAKRHIEEVEKRLKEREKDTLFLKAEIKTVLKGFIG